MFSPEDDNEYLYVPPGSDDEEESIEMTPVVSNALSTGLKRVKPAQPQSKPDTPTRATMRLSTTVPNDLLEPDF